MSTDIASANEVVSGTKLSRYGKELLMELKRSDWLPGYASEKIQLVCKDIDEHFKNMDHLMKSIDTEQGLPDNLKACLLIHYQTVQRNKRCLMAYTDYRLSKTEKLKWEYGSVMPSQYVPKLSQSEVQYFKKYDNLLNDYMRSIDIELTSVSSFVFYLSQMEMLHPIACLTWFDDIVSFILFHR